MNNFPSVIFLISIPSLAVPGNSIQFFDNESFDLLCFKSDINKLSLMFLFFKLKSGLAKIKLPLFSF